MEESLHVSLDLETLDTRQTAVVAAVGAVFFTPTKIFTKYPFYRQLQLEPQFRKHRTINEDTLIWWMQQSDEARLSTFVGKQKLDPVTLFNVLFGQWAERWGVGLYGEPDFPVNPHVNCSAGEIKGWWTNGPSFDTAIMENMAAQFEVPLPHRYNQPRDFRTLRDMLPKALVPTREGTYHNGLDDAIYQARVIQAVWKMLDDHVTRGDRWVTHACTPPQSWNDFTPAERLLRWPERDSITGHVVERPSIAPRDVIHALRGGAGLCGFSAPGSAPWPAGHAWSSDDDIVTCENCKRHLPPTPPSGNTTGETRTGA